MNKLPDTPSALIRVAIADMEKVLSMPQRYRIVMNTWHNPIDIYTQEEFASEDMRCCVCFAGSVMAQTLGIDDKLSVDVADDEVAFMVRSIKKNGDFHTPVYIDEDTSRKLFALNEFRAGSPMSGIITFYRHLPEKELDFHRKRWLAHPYSSRMITPYKADHPEIFLQEMRELADHLEQAGM